MAKFHLDDCTMMLGAFFGADDIVAKELEDF